jgi:phospholipid/cholesterol/gamma-HCH transport system substrate-binding protein
VLVKAEVSSFDNRAPLQDEGPPGRPNRRHRWRTAGPKFVGLVTMLVSAIVVTLLFVPTSLQLGRTTFYAELSQAGGLVPNDEVRIAGVRVGNVRSLEVRDARVRVSFGIQRDIDLGPDTTASVRVATLLGNHYLELKPAGTGDLPGATIPLANTTVPFEVKDIIEAGAVAVEELDGDKLRQALQVLADDLRDTPALTTVTLDGLSRLSTVIVSRDRQLGRLIRSANAVTSNLNANRAQLIELMQQASLVFVEITRRRDAIRELLADTQALADQLVALVRENDKKLTPMLTNLNVVLTTLQRNDKALERTAILLGPAARYFANATGNGPYLDVVAPNAIFPDSTLCRIQAEC